MSLVDEQQRAELPDPAIRPRVSVIVPVFNAADSLANALRSALSQTLAELEVVVVDDCSTDDSVSVAEALAADDPRVVIHRHPRNRGQAAARNLALEKARGEWIAVLDADDEIDPQRLEALCAVGDREQADLVADGVVFAGSRTAGTPRCLRPISDNGSDVRMLTLEALIESDIPLNGIVSFGYLKPVMRRAFLDRHELRYDESLRFAEDLNLYVRALAAGGRFVLHPETYYIYNQTPASASRGSGVLPDTAVQALSNSRRMRELCRRCGSAELDDLLAEHEQRWSTVLWFNRVKLALRDRRLSELMQLTLACPSSPGSVLRFARDRVRTKRSTREAVGS